MQLTTQGSSQLQSIFGSGYVAEQHGDDTQRHLPSEDSDSAVNFRDILNALRSALSLR